MKKKNFANPILRDGFLVGYADRPPVKFDSVVHEFLCTRLIIREFVKFYSFADLNNFAPVIW
jgi:hypothetical protein